MRNKTNTAMTESEAKAGSRLIDYLTDTGYTRTKIKQLLKHRAIKVNGAAVKRHDLVLVAGDIVSVIRGNKETAVVPALGIKLVYEDDSVMVIEKPAGLLTIASDKEKTKTAYYRLNEFLGQRDPKARERIFIVHRLDRDTSGLILFAKSEAIKRKLQGSWKEFEKRYYAVVDGVPAKKAGEIKSRLKETKSLRVQSNEHSSEAKFSITKYRVIKQGQGYALLDILLETGRKNQIRVHLADIGHPVAGDRKYGAKRDPFRRLGLHAFLLNFNHPLTGERLSFKSKMPDRFGILTMKSVKSVP